ncbi:MAG: polysaccharide biosynthesis C-terminal domain-containing protein [Crocinitomicaceae bacterium]|nr:polysaccharide biosynthesis C-terminal domain-containing protein [Flavobacteriales bacterium]NQZ36076.1 polysaccharide biosynthesis C-terminal domain-containing protein [Crocinitomicaceae bacterium]
MGIIQKDALRTTIVSYIGMLLGYVNKVLLFVILLSQEEVGLINLILSLSLLFAQFSNLGSINSTWKFFPYLFNPKRKHYGFLSLNLIIALVGVILFSLVFILFKDSISAYFESRSSRFVQYYYWVIPVGSFMVIFKLLENYLRGLYKNVFAVVANDFILRIVTTIILLFYALAWFDFHILVVLICLSQAIPVILLIGYMIYLNEWHVSLKSISIPKKFQKIILVYSMYSYMNTLAAILVISLDSIMIAGLIGLADLGVYSIVLYIIRALMIPYAAIMRVSSPIVAQYWKDRDMVKMNELYKRVSSVTLFIGLFLFLGTWVSIDEIFSLLPKGYSFGIPVFLMLMIGRIVDMYMGLNGTILVTSKKYRYDIIFTGSLIVVVYVLNVLFIPKWGISGAALSTTIAYLLYNLLRLFFVWKWYKIHPFKLNQLKVIVLFTIVLVSLIWLDLDLGNMWLTMIANSILVVILFPLVIYVTKMEPEVVEYVDKIIGVVKLKLGKKE